jgi:osmotically inducible lipoprotein OsmB
MRRRELRNKSRYYMVSLRRNWEDRVVNKIALVSLACLTLGACSTPTQTVGTLGGVATGAAIGGPVGAVVGGAVGAVATRPGSALGYHDRYGHVHYRC